MANRTRAMHRSNPLKFPTSWARLVTPVYGTVAAASKVLIGSFTLAGVNAGVTVRRTRGEYSIISDQTGADEDQLGAWGMVVVNDIAVAAGVASLPGPVTDLDDDGWFVWEPFLQHGREGDIPFLRLFDIVTP